MSSEHLLPRFSIFPDDARSTLIKKNIYFSFLIKGLSILASFLLVPLTLNYLSVYEYGVWLTLSSIFTWISYFDIGLGNGLRNQLATSISVGDKKLGQIYVSTTFFLLSLIISAGFLLFILLQPYLDWAGMLNVDPAKILNLNRVITLTFAFFCFNFLFKIIGIVYVAAQRPAVNDLITLLGNLLALLVIFILTKTTQGTLMKVALTLSAAPALILIIAYPVTFYGRFRELRPSITTVKPGYTKVLANLGLQFFILQISSLVIFGTSNIIISKIFGPEQVTPYNIAFKYFSIATMAFNIVLAPMWSASTDAYAQGDLHWLKNSMKGMLRIWGMSSAAVVVLILCANVAYQLWIGSTVTIPFSLTLWMGLYTVLLLWSTCYSTFLFGIGKLKLQLINTLAIAILYIPLALLLSRSFGIKGIVIALCLSNLSGAILNPMQYKRIISGNASGIWNR